VFHALSDARFERDASRRALAALDLPPELIDLDAIARGDRIATDRLLWDVWRKRPSALELGDGTDATAFELADEDLPAAAAALRELGAARDPDAGVPRDSRGSPPRGWRACSRMSWPTTGPWPNFPLSRSPASIDANTHRS
jgi:hypothetical protein